jgi:hypothetical protein
MSMSETATNFILTVTALVAVILTPGITVLVTRWQTGSAAKLAQQQIATSGESVRQQIASASSIAQQQIRAQIVSTNRQNWINTLRDTIAEMQSLAAVLALDSEDHFLEKEDRISHSQRIAFLHSKAALLINPAEPDHASLLEALGHLTYRAMNPGASVDHSFRKLQLEITSQAQPVLKREWERVKSGE